MNLVDVETSVNNTTTEDQRRVAQQGQPTPWKSKVESIHDSSHHDNKSINETMAGIGVSIPSMSIPTSNHAHVLYVLPHHAKDIKTMLEGRGWIDKRYRMTKSYYDWNHSTKKEEMMTTTMTTTTTKTTTCTNVVVIAIPVTIECWKQIAISPSKDDHRMILKENEEEPSWISTIVGKSQVEMPWSTSQFARHKKKVNGK